MKKQKKRIVSSRHEVVWKNDLFSDALQWADMLRQIHENAPDSISIFYERLAYYKDRFNPTLEDIDQLEALSEEAIQDVEQLRSELPPITAKLFLSLRSDSTIYNRIAYRISERTLKADAIAFLHYVHPASGEYTDVWIDHISTDIQDLQLIAKRHALAAVPYNLWRNSIILRMPTEVEEIASWHTDLHTVEPITPFNLVLPNPELSELDLVEIKPFLSFEPELHSLVQQIHVLGKSEIKQKTEAKGDQPGTVIHIKEYLVNKAKEGLQSAEQWIAALEEIAQPIGDGTSIAPVAAGVADLVPIDEKCFPRVLEGGALLIKRNISKQIYIIYLTECNAELVQKILLIVQFDTGDSQIILGEDLNRKASKSEKIPMKNGHIERINILKLD